MQIQAIMHFVFVDFENVPEVDLGLVTGKPAHVMLLLGKHQKKLDVALVQQIRRLADQVELVEVGASGHNALDLTLAYYLGQAVHRHPEAWFYVVSKDNDFDPMLAHLHAQKVEVARFASFAELPFLPQPKTAAATRKLPEDRRAKVIARLNNPAIRNRPSSRKALLAHINTALGKETSETGAADILRELVDSQVLSIDALGKVTYAAAPRPAP
jgi:hypothetical protein